MPGSATPSTFADAGRRGARKRWAGHVPKVIRLDDVAPEQRAFIVELVEVAKRNAPRPNEAA